MSKSVTFDVTRRIPAGKSSNLAKLEYSTESKVLRVEFRNGGVYDYSDVPVTEAAPGLTLELGPQFSIGSWLATSIKPFFPATKVSRELEIDTSLDGLSTEEYNAEIMRRREARAARS